MKMHPQPLPGVLVVLVRPPQAAIGGGGRSTLQIALRLKSLNVEVRLVERSPALRAEYGTTVDAKVMNYSRGILGLNYIGGVVGAAIKSRSGFIYAYADYFQDTIVPAVVAAVITRKRLYVNVLDDERRAEDILPFPSLLKNRLRRRPEILPFLEYAMFHGSRRLAVRIGTCLTASRFSAEYAKNVLHARRVLVIGRGVDSQFFEAGQLQQTVDGLYVGRFDVYKRVSMLVKAWKLVVARRPEAKLMLVGESGKEFGPVTQLVKDLGISQNVVFVGHVTSRGELAGLMRASRLFIFPSIKEGFGRAVAEAMAAGVPCVLSDIAPFRELYSDAAVFAEPDDASGFAGAILDLLDDEAKRLECSRRSLVVARKFSWDTVARKVLLAMTSQ